MKKRKINFIAELPREYFYKFIEIDGVTKLIGAHPKLKPIVVELDGTFREIELKAEDFK